jgi:O-antigen/teichoic acid export membrane protein
MAAFILSYVLIAVYIMVIHNKKLPFTVQLGVVKGLIKVGFPLMVYGLTHVLFATIDRLIIMWQLDIKSLGYYSFASSIAEMAGIFSSGIGFVYFPKLIREFAARGNPADLQKTFSNITKALMLVGPFFLSVTFLGSILLIRGWYKNYLDAMVPLAFILLGKYFMIISSITGSVFIAINDIKSLMKATFAVVIITAILDLFAVAAGFKINGIALASLAGGILYAVLTLYMAIKRMGSKDFSCITDSVRYFLLMVIQFFIIFVITGNNIGIALPENYRGISLAISIIFLAVSSAYLLKKIFKTEFVKELAVYFKGLSRRKGPDLFYDELQGSQ